jgi:hypothetical protein
MDFSEKDKKQIKEHGLTSEEVEKQIDNFKKGFPYIDIVKPVTHNDGVVIIDDMPGNYFANLFSEHAQSLKIVKMVPASGAATRMFKDFYEFLQTGKMTPEIRTALDNITEFAFWKNLQTVLPKNPTEIDIIKGIITLYGNTPKGLIPFHKYGNDIATALEEHLKEGAQYAVSFGNTVNIHFTVSPEHRKDFESLLNKLVQIYKAKFHLKEYNFTISEQDKSTDTIAVNKDFTPFRNSDGSLLFRAAGHGALTKNLNEIDADLVFIKNIDNVQPDNLRNDTIKYNKMLAGKLVHVQKQIFNLIRQIDSGRLNVELLTKILHDFINNELSIKLQEKLSLSEYRKILNRPIRVCGVVKNTGAPGGGPFWVRDSNGNISLQIVESSQINPEFRENIMSKSEYFNPVFMVCGIRDLNGNKFDLTQYVDENTGFISQKSKDGKDLLAMELPGLWNGAMAKYNTMFVEVPKSIFSPAKTIFDLLKQEHNNKMIQKG